MSIATVDDLVALYPGVEVIVDSTVGKRRYVRTDDGRLRHTDTGALIQPEMFVGSIVAGAVRLATEDPPEVGALFSTGGYHWLVVAVDGSTVHLGQFRRAVWGGFRAGSVAQFADRQFGDQVGDADRPDWLPVVAPVVAALWATNQQLREAERRMQERLDNPIPESVVEDLHNYAASVEDDAFENLLARQGIGRQRMHSSEVRLNGTVPWTPLIEPAREQTGLGRDFTLEIAAVPVYWQRTVTIERQGIGCTCGEIDEDDLRPWCPPEYQNLDWEANCA